MRRDGRSIHGRDIAVGITSSGYREGAIRSDSWRIMAFLQVFVGRMGKGTSQQAKGRKSVGDVKDEHDVRLGTL